MKITHNKLVRDNIPQILTNAHKQFKIHSLNEDEYKFSLMKKIIEEANELANSISLSEITSETADLLEVIEALLIVYKINLSDVMKCKEIKADSNGAFKQKIFLEYVEESEHE